MKPKIIVKTAGLSREEWLKYRKKGIGGSDSAAVIGLNPYKSQIELWADKTGRLDEQEDNEAMRIGRDLEEYVAKRFCEATGKNVKRRNAMFANAEFPFIIADVDREIVGENAGLECKTTSAMSRSDFENGVIPSYYYVQCVHYMNVMGYDKMYLAVLVMGRAFYWFEINRDEEECKSLLQAEKKFWEECIVPDVRPEPDGSDCALRTLNALPRSDTDEVQMMFDYEDKIKQFEELSSKIKELEKTRDERKQEIIAGLGELQLGMSGNYEISYCNQTRVSVATKELKEQYPEIYNKLAKPSTSRVFRLKKRKDG